jgi:YhcG PDDEXK nuclease domain
MNPPGQWVVIDLKIEDFKPEFAGKMNFYLNAVDELERQPQDEPSIGLVLCPGRNKTVTEWALRGVDARFARHRACGRELVQRGVGQMRLCTRSSCGGALSLGTLCSL